MNINELPPEILINIFGYLGQLELLNTVIDVCRNWRHITKDVSLWQQIDLNCLVIGQDEKDLLKRIAEISPNMQCLKVSPTRLVHLSQHSGDNEAFTNLRKLELTPFEDEDIPAKVFDNLRNKCPKLKCLQLSILSNHIYALKSLFRAEFPIEEVRIYHRFSLKDKELTDGENHRLSALLNENSVNIRKTNNLRIYSFSFKFLSSFLDVSFENLVGLGAFGRHIVHEDLRRLTRKVNLLTELRIDYSKVKDDDLCTVAENNPHLKELSLQCCVLITDEGVSRVTKVCKKLERLLLRNSTTNCLYYGEMPQHQSRVSLQAVSDHCSSLVQFSAQNLDTFDDTKLSTITRSCRQLTTLSFNACSLLTDSALDVIGQNCPKLKSGDFSQCPAISLNGVWNMISGCLEMRTLSLTACEGLTQFSSEEQNPESDNQKPPLQYEDSNNSSHKNPDLQTSKIQTLNVSYCDSLEPSSLSKLSEKCTNLQVLVLRFSKNMYSIPSDIIRDLYANCPFLRKILYADSMVLLKERRI